MAIDKGQLLEEYRATLNDNSKNLSNCAKGWIYSLIYQQDVTNNKQAFSAFEAEITKLKSDISSAVSYASEAKTSFTNTVGSVNTLKSRIPDDVTVGIRHKIQLASLETYKELLSEFNAANTSFLSAKKFFDMTMKTWSEYETAISQIEEKIRKLEVKIRNFSLMSIPDKNIKTQLSNYKSTIEKYNNYIEGCSNNCLKQLTEMQKQNTVLSKLLEEGLKKV